MWRQMWIRGVDLDALLDMSTDDLVKLFTARARRRFQRGLKRKPMALIKKMRKAKREAPAGEKPKIVKTHLRNMIIVPKMIRSVVEIDVDDDIREEFMCPFCTEYFDIMGLCCHIDDEHHVEVKNGVCPVCAMRVGVDMVAHITLQHGNIVKVQRNLWEVIWADQAAIRVGMGKSGWGRMRMRAPPTDDLLLYAIAACVLQRRKLIIEKYGSMDEILRECNSMAGHLDVWRLLDDAHDLVVAMIDGSACWIVKPLDG
ncbi:hypothetical protein LguiA_002031 [Lonicera macranthoides]